jgi:hypothetical protein
MVEPKVSGQLGRVKIMSKVKALFGWQCFSKHCFFVLLKDVFGKHAPKPILTFLVLEKNGFLSNMALKKMIYAYCIRPILTKDCILFIKK